MIAAALFGLGFQALIGSLFGADARTDAFFMSVSIFAFLAKFLMLGQLKSIALPLVGQAAPGGEPRLAAGAGGAVDTARLASLVRLTLLGTGLLVLILMAAAPLLVRGLAPGFDEGQRALTADLLRIRLPALAATAAVTVSLAGFEARRRFGTAVTAQKVVPAVAAFAGLLWWGDRTGVEGLAWIGMASAVASLVFVVLAWPALLSGSVRRAARDAVVRGIGRRWIRFSQATVATTLGEWAFRVGASLLPVGVFSALLYGRRVHDVFHGAVNDSMTTVTLPELSTRAAGGDAAVGRHLDRRVLDLLTASLPLGVGTMVAAPWIIALLFGRGAFVQSGMLGQASTALALYMAAFVVQGVNQLGFAAAFATDRSHEVNRVQTTGHLVRAAAVIPLALAFGLPGLVGAQLGMNVLVLGLWTRAWPEELRPSPGLPDLAKRIVATGAAAAVPYALLRSAGDPMAWSSVARAGMLLGGGLGAIVVYLAACRFLGVPLPLRGGNAGAGEAGPGPGTKRAAS